jgi:hypothetical protein
MNRKEKDLERRRGKRGKRGHYKTQTAGFKLKDIT